MREALENNKDLDIATANVERAFAQYGITRSALFPQVDANASASRQRLSENAGPPRVRSSGEAFNDYSLDLSLGYEIDLWGRLRRATEAARADLLASEEGRRTVVLTLVSSVANGYIDLRALDRQLEIARNTSQSLFDATRLQLMRFQEGATPESDYRQAESQYRTAAAQVPELERQVARQENFISVLLGRNPGPVARGRAIDDLALSRGARGAAGRAARAPPRHPAGGAEPDRRQRRHRRGEGRILPAHQPHRRARPAKRRALRSLPQLVAHLVARHRRDRCRSSMPDASATRSRRPRPAQRAALASYRQSIIVAFQEVENALVDRAKLGEAQQTQAFNVVALQRFRDLADLRYREGATIYLEVANAEQSLFNAQLAYVATQSRLFQSYANLYRAMGGGWVAEAEKLAGAAR